MSRDYSIVSVISNLTRAEASKLNSSIVSSKEKCAPNSRGTMVTGKTENVSSMLSKGQKNYLGSGNHGKKAN